MVLNLYSCARRGVDIICALRAFNEAILVDERIRCGGGCGFGEGRHGCVFVGVCGRTGAPLSCGGVPVRLFGVLWRCPTLPQPVGCSTIGAAGLSFQVRNGAGRFPGAVTTTSFVVQPPPRGLRCCSCPAGRRGGGGCGLIVVCIVVAAVSLPGFCSPQRCLCVGCCLVLAH